MVNQAGRWTSRVLWMAVLAAAVSSCGRRAGSESSAVIDPSGGQASVPSSEHGKVVVDVPSGALDEQIELTVRVLSADETPAGSLSPGIELGPHGTRFAKPVAIRFQPKVRETFASIPLPLYRVATYVDDHWEVLPTKLLPGGVVEGLTTHFSTFALVAECMLVGTGTDFPLTACPTFNPRVTTSEEVTLSLNAGQLMTNIFVAADPSAGEVQLKVEGLRPETKYYVKSDEATVVEEVLTDEAGALEFARNLNQPRQILVSTVHGSLTLDSPSVCVPPLGAWSAEDSTCRLLEDLPEAEVTIVVDGLTLDCRDPVTGAIHKIGSADTRTGFGINIYGRTNITVRNCELLNVDNGILASLSSGLVIDNVGIESSRPAAGLFLRGATEAALSHLRIQNVHIGVYSQPGNRVRLASSQISNVEYGVSIYPGDGPVTDVSIRNATFGLLAGQPYPFSIERVGIINDPTTPGSTGIFTFGGAHPVIRDSVVARMLGSGITIDKHSAGTMVTGTTISCASQGLALFPISPAPITIFHNNFLRHGTAVSNYGTVKNLIELSDANPTSPSFQQGNFWGHDCAGALFGASDANSSYFLDSYPYGRMSAWNSGGAPACNMSLVLAPPTPVAPASGALALVGSPVFMGAAEPGATVELLEGAVVRGQGVVDECGIYAFTPTSPFSDGPHTVSLRARKDGGTSAPSSSQTFSVGTGAMLPVPELTAPSSGTILSTSTPVFMGTATPGSTVELLEQSTFHGGAVTGADGNFTLQPSIPFLDGLHVVTVRASLGQSVSPNSAPVEFSVDTTPPLPPTVSFPGVDAIITEYSVLVVGSAEPLARIALEESGAIVGEGQADSEGIFSIRIPWLENGQHTVAGRATDVAANVSDLGSAVPFTVASTVSGSNGRLEVTRVYDAPDAFAPSVGEANALHVEGTVTIPSGGGQRVYTVVIERRVFSQATGTLVRTIGSSVLLSPAPGASSVSFSHEVPWDGQDGLGAPVPEGVYTSMTALQAVDSGNTRTSHCLSTLPSGGCMFDYANITTTVELSATAILNRPTTVAAGTSLIEVAKTIVPVGEGILIISEAAFQAALLSGTAAPATEEAKALAVTLAGMSNDPLSTGAVGSLYASDGMQSFSGELFVVARNAQSTSDGRYVGTSDYFVAAVSLTGLASYVGVVQGIAASATGTAPSADCCGAPSLCAPTDPTGTGGCGPTASCPPTDTLVTWAGSTFGDTTLSIYGGLSSSGTLSPSTFSCNVQLFPTCTVAQPTCDPADYLTVQDSSSGGSQPCGPTEPRMPAPQGAPRPDTCNYGLWESPPPECGGWSPNFGALSWSTSGLGAACALVRPEDPGAGICSSHEPAMQEALNQQMQFEVVTSGCAGDQGEIKNGVTCCGANCFCEEEILGTSGNETIKATVCTECIGGECHQFAQRVWAESLVESRPTICICLSCPDGKCRDEGSAATGVVVTKDVNPPVESPPTLQSPSEGGEKEPIEVAKASKPDKGMDPVSLGAGSFDLNQTDLSFDGPVRPLDFQRVYDSQSSGRSTLGSNWRHNWDVRLQPLREGAAPSWVPAYCLGTRLEPTCLLLEEGTKGSRLFYLDLATGLFMPQAGSTDTVAIVKPGGGWKLRRADGSTLLFDDQGYLKEDRDRFGNGFTVEYEPTPLGALYSHFCPKALVFSRKCAVLAHLVDDGARPDPTSEAWRVAEADFPVDPRLSDDAEIRLHYARAYFLALLRRGLESQGPFVRVPFGSHTRRPVVVRDDLGRALVFSYFSASIGSLRGPAGLDGALNADLLKEVRGPAGTLVRFVYGAPAAHPRRLAEQFLVSVTREDAPKSSDLDVEAAPNRTFAFTYQWPESTPYTDTEGPRRLVEDRYFDYFRTFRGCGYTFQPGGCFGGAPSYRFIPGDPNLLARDAAEQFVSDVADNILSVSVSGRVESETRYDVDPFSMEFDRVVAQRYGASQAIQDETRLPPDDASFAWQTQLPRTHVAYRSAGVNPAGGDETDSFLPTEIKARYPLEGVPSNATLPTAYQATPAPSEDTSGFACHFELVDPTRRALPGYHDSFSYFELPSFPDVGDGLKRSPLSCDALAMAQVADPKHNDLVSEINTIEHLKRFGTYGWTKPTLSLAYLTIVPRGRARIAKDTNRICSWSKVIDRDGDVHFYGLNFRGQVLVDALEERGGGFLYTERVFNADGNISQERRPTRAATWSATEGFTRYTYDDADTGPSDRSFGVPYPFWVRRNNLVLVEVRPRGETVLDVAEGTSLSVATSAGRFEEYTYEPLFQQPLVVKSGALQGNRVVHREVSYEYDYQELNATASMDKKDSLFPVYLELMPFGFRTLPNVPLWGADLNGDRVLGSPTPVGQERFRARGLPVRVTRKELPAAGGDLVETYVWAPHGLPAQIHRPEGGEVLFDYYAPDAPFGASEPPSGSTAGPNYKGLLARVRVTRVNAAVPPSQGPSTQPCLALKGPYQWLLPSSCSASPSDELKALGLPQSVIEGVEAVSNSNTSTLSTSFAYSKLGKIRHTWLDTGETHVVRDTDGRVLKSRDVLGNTTTDQFDVFGNPVRTTRTGSDGANLGATERRFDDEGRLLFECTETASGGCNGAMIPSSGGVHPNGVAHQYTYTPEGQLASQQDGEGLIIEHQYDERKLLRMTSARPVTQTGPARQVVYSYNEDGDLTQKSYGTPSSTSLERLQERFEYDGLRRLKKYVDTRGYAWHLGNSSRDLLARFKQDATGYETPGGAAAWETYFGFDGFGRLTERGDNGVEVTKFALTKAGFVYALERTGAGKSFTTYDLQGNPLWSMDSAGNQQLFTWRSQPHVETSSQVRVDGSGNRWATSSVRRLNAAGQALGVTQVGGTQERTTTLLRSAAGFVREQTEADGHVTVFERNYLGWLTTVREESQSAGGYESSSYRYNMRGQVTQVADPSGSITTQSYNELGELTGRVTPGSPAVALSFSYDSLGRLATRTSGMSAIRLEYDKRGDAVAERLVASGQLLSTRSFDALGRVTGAVNYNPSLSWLPEGDRRVEQAISYDGLGRVLSDGLKVGQGALRALNSSWQLSADSTWARTSSFAGGSSSWTQRFDSVGRLSGLDKAGKSTAFQWQGEWYLGRTQSLPGRSSPFREERQLDALGQLYALEYRAIDVEENGHPVEPSEGVLYCGGSWSVADCSSPLLRLETLRDKMGQLASLKWAYGHPVFNAGGVRVPTSHARPWRGYAYSEQHRLVKSWEHAGQQPEVSTADLSTHSVTTAQVEQLGATADPWRYVREATVGGTLSITNDTTGSAKWVGNRGVGHQLESAIVDGRSRVLAHDSEGRLVNDGLFTFEYDPRGQLAVVRNTRGVLEAYAYDDAGRLAAVWSGQGLDSTYVYDGVQMVGAFGVSGTLKWEASWGPGVDSLVSWTDVAGGTGTFVPLVDHRNSVVSAWSEASGKVLEQVEYTPEGRLLRRNSGGTAQCQEEGSGRICSGVAGMPFGFASAWRSSRSGMVFMRNRWYSPQLGEFLSHDPVGFRDSFNLYAYVGFDPINGWDPYGLESNGFSFLGMTWTRGDGTDAFGEAVGFAWDVVRQIDPLRSTDENRQIVEGALSRDGRSAEEIERTSGLVIRTANQLGYLTGGAIAGAAWFRLNPDVYGHLSGAIQRLKQFRWQRPTIGTRPTSPPGEGIPIGSPLPGGRVAGEGPGAALRDGVVIPDAAWGGASIPRRLARVIPGDVSPATLGRPGSADVFVTAADDIAGMTPAQIAERLAIPESRTFTVIEFPTPLEGLASPVLRSNVGFVGGGRTAGGAREFVIPNGPIPPESTIRRVGP